MSNRGAITVFLTLITTVMLAFAGTLIDGARIILAGYTVESAVQSATRSVMSNYDKDLVGQYGLFAIDDNDKNKEVFRQYFENNLSLVDKHPAVEKTRSLLQFKKDDIVSTKVEFYNPIIDDDVFRDQLREYMAPRATVIAVHEVVNKFKDGLMSYLSGKLSSQDINKAKTAQDSLDDVKNDALNGKIDTFNTANNDIGFKIITKEWAKKQKTKAKAAIAKGAVDAVAESLWNSIDTLSDVNMSSFPENSAFENKIKEIEKEIEKLETAVDAIKQPISLGTGGSALGGDDTDVYDYMTEGTKTTEIEDRIATIKSNIETARNKLIAAKNTYNQNVNTERILRCAAVLVDLEYFDEASEFLRNKGLPDVADSLDSAEDVNEKADILYEQIKSTNDIMNDAIEELTNFKIEKMIEIKKPEVKNEKKAEAENKELELTNKLNEFKNFFGGYFIRNIDQYEIFKNSDGVKILRAIWELIGMASPGFQVIEDAWNFLNSATGMVVSVADGSFGDNVLITAYVMDKTNYLTSTTRRSHYFNIGETEYIIEDRTFEWDNISHTVGSVTKMRFNINTLYYFIKNADKIKAPVLLLVVTGYSAIRGGIQTAFDMFEMVVMGGECDLIPNIPISVSYRDHMTYLVFMEANKAVTSKSVQHRLINTMQATLKYNDSLKGSGATGADMTNLKTSVRTEATVKVDLIFLRFFGFTHIDENIKNGSYAITRSVEFSY